VSHAAHYPSQHTQGFASLLYVVFVLEKGHRVDRVAPQLDVAPSTLYEYIRGTRVFPPDLLAPLYLATRERRFLAFFLDECDVEFHALPECQGDPDVGSLQQMIRAQERFLGLLKSYAAARQDGAVTRSEIVEIEREYYEAQAALAQLLACARAEARRPGREG
jgi:hypothetical protein